MSSPARVAEGGEVGAVRGEREGQRRRAEAPVGPGLKGSIGEGPNHSNFSDESSINIVSEFSEFC